MSFVASDRRDIVLCLEAMKDLVIARGGLVHPAAQIEERDGAMRVICRDPRADGQTLFGIPHGLLVPLDALAWAELDDTLQTARPPRGISPDQQEMLGLLVAVYNAAGKLHDARHHAAIVLAHDSEFAAQTGLVKNLSLAASPSAATAFLSSRSFCDETVLEGKTCLMPLADCFNHHAAGASPQSTDGRLSFGSVRAEGTEECFINYGGNRDPLDLALHYHYVDRGSPYAASVPLELHLPGFGRLVVRPNSLAPTTV